MRTQDERPRGHLLTVTELSQLLSVPASWVYAHVASGDLPHVKVGRYVRFRPAEISEWLGAERVCQ